jgi:6-pyruvoyltetrahydropterin/6-carboxytetrahydropterin synthase
MSSSVTVRHNFETAHRLPHLSGKCQNLHGHSWWAEVTVEAHAVDARGAVVEFGAFKARLREWIDRELDHGAMLHRDDELADLLEHAGCKVYRTRHYPTVENTARMLAGIAEAILTDLEHAAGARVTRVHVSETHVNGASWDARALPGYPMGERP